MKRLLAVSIFVLLLASMAQALTMPKGLTMTELRWVAVSQGAGTLRYDLWCTIKNTSKDKTYSVVVVECCLLDKVKGKGPTIRKHMENLAPGDFWRFAAVSVAMSDKEDFNKRFSGRIESVTAH